MNAFSWRHSAGSALNEREREEQSRIVRLYKALGCTVWALSQYRPSGQSAGLPDLIVKHPGRHLSWSHELKAKAGRVSKPQQQFADLCEACGDRHVIGGYRAGVDFLKSVGLIAENWTP